LAVLTPETFVYFLEKWLLLQCHPGLQLLWSWGPKPAYII